MLQLHRFHWFLKPEFIAKMSGFAVPRNVSLEIYQFFSLECFLFQFQIHRCNPFEYRLETKRANAIS